MVITFLSWVLCLTFLIIGNVESNVTIVSASESASWYSTSRSRCSGLMAVTTAPALRAPKYEIMNWGMLGKKRATLSPLFTPSLIIELANLFESVSSWE